MRRMTRVSMIAVMAALLVSLLPGPVGAQPSVIWPPLPPAPSFDGIHVDEHSVRAEIDGPVAEVTVTQVFRNDSGSLVEGTFLFPLPADATVGEFQMSVNGEVLEGQLMGRDAARSIYEETVRQVRDPALLEYAGQGLFRTSVFPIPPGESRTLQLRYHALLDTENGLHRFWYPLRVPGATRPAKRTDLVVELRSDDGLRAVYSPSHDVEVERSGDDAATVRFVSADEPLTADFDLYFGSGGESVGLNLISHKPAGEDGYFVLLAAPSVEVDTDEVAARDVVFVVDVSGSMEGPKLAQAKDAVRYVTEHLNADDRFNLIAFSTGVELRQERLSSVEPENVDGALAWIERLEASGSTDINRALLEALAQVDADPDGRPSYILFMTDGLPTQGETEVHKIIANAENNLATDTPVRLFPFGVGFDVNTDLLDTLSEQMGGRTRYVRPDEPIDEAVSDFYATIQTPVLTDVAVEFGDGTYVSDTFPYPLPDLFAGEQLVVTGRYRNGGETSVALTGRVGDERVRYVYPNQSLVNAGGESFVARLWATRTIGALMAQIRRDGANPELVDAIVELSMRYGIVTPYTSYLVEEPQMSQRPAQGPGGGEAAQPRALMDTAQASVEAMAEEAMAAPASGAAAVEASMAREKLRSADTVEEFRDVRYAGGKAFVSQGQVTQPDGSEATLWVDTAYRDEMAIETVGFASERYFELADDAAIREAFALSTEVLVVLDEGNAVRVTAEADVELGALEEPPVAMEGSGSGTTLWAELLQWLAGDGRR